MRQSLRMATVLILILMEDALRVAVIAGALGGVLIVLILILMEDALRGLFAG